MKADFIILVFITLVPASWLVIGVLSVVFRLDGRVVKRNRPSGPAAPTR
jgi:hypothetical protein